LGDCRPSEARTALASCCKKNKVGALRVSQKKASTLGLKLKRLNQTPAVQIHHSNSTMILAHSTRSLDTFDNATQKLITDIANCKLTEKALKLKLKLLTYTKQKNQLKMTK
jgi:hypothetical protein